MAWNAQSVDQVATDVKSALVACKGSVIHGLTPMELDREYREQLGHSIPYRDLGYSCLLDFLQILQRRNVIKIVQKGGSNFISPCVTADLRHVSKLVTEQKSSPKNRSRGGGSGGARRGGRHGYYVKPYHPPRLETPMLDNVVRLIRNEPGGINTNAIMDYLRDRIDYRINEQQLTRQLSELTHDVVVRGNIVYPVQNKQTSWGQMSRGMNDNSSNVSRNQNHRSSSYRLQPGGLSASNDHDDRRTCPAVADAAPRSLAEINYNRRETVKRAMEKNANLRYREDENRNDVAHVEDATALVDETTKSRLEKIIRRHPQGLWCAELPALYHKEYGITMNYTGLGFGSVIEFAACYPDVFRWSRPQPHGDFKLFDVNAPQTEEIPSDERVLYAGSALASVHDNYQSCSDEDEKTHPTTESPATTRRLIPDDVLTMGETVAQISVTELFSNGQNLLEVIVVEVVTPTFFWIQERKRVPTFEAFMTELHQFYTLNASKYVMPMIVLEKGLNCACLFDGCWHRGIIKSVKPDSTVTIMFYDYGTVKSYQPNEIHFLHRKFSCLPAQAIACGLWNIKPKIGNKWSLKTCQKFSEIAFDMAMVATGVSIDVDNNSMFIGLTNTEGTEDVHINDWMVNGGFAVYGKMGNAVDTNETHDDAPIIGTTSNETTSAEIMSLLLEVFKLAAGNVEQPTNTSINPETKKSHVDSPFNDLSSYNNFVANASSEMLNRVIQQARTILTMQSMINNATASNDLRSDVAATSDIDGDQSQSVAEFASHEKFCTNNLDDLFKKMSIDDQAHWKKQQQQFETSRTSPTSSIPSTTKPQNEALDVNMNVNANPFKRPTFIPPDRKFVEESMIDNENVKSSPTTRSIFDKSVEKSSSRLHELSNLNSTSTLSDTNPFKFDIDNNDNRSTNHRSVTKESSFESTMNNPFFMDNYGIFRGTTETATRVVYEAGPVMYDLARKNENSVVSARDERKVLEASKQRDVARWIENGGRSANQSGYRVNECQSLGQNVTTNTCKSVDGRDCCNFTSYRGTAVTPDVTVQVEKSKIPPPLPPRPKPVVDSRRSELATADGKIRSRTGLAESNFVGMEEAIEFEIKVDGTRPEVATDERAIIDTDRDNETARTVNQYNCKEIQLTKQSIVLIQMDGEGWLTVHDFVTAFTNYKIPEAVIKILEIRNARIPFRLINRPDYPLLFDQLDRTSLAAERDCDNRIRGALNLAPIKSMMKILILLRIVKRERAENATSLKICTKNSSALLDYDTIITDYVNLPTNGISPTS